MTLTPSAEYCKKSVQETIQAFNADIINGLLDTNIETLRLKHGKNELEKDDDEPLYLKFLEQFRQPLILLLLGSAGVSTLMGQFDDAISITLAITIVVTVAFIQEYRSEKSLEALEKLVPHYCHVLRDKRFITVLGHELVPGDVVKFSFGDRIPADLRLIKSTDLEIDESNLTGETKPVRKTISSVGGTSEESIAVTERKNCAFMGTLVRSGNGMGIVIATGKSTEFGSIWMMMKDMEVKKTPLQMKMEELGKQLSILSFGVIGVISIVGLIQGKPWLETFTIAVSLAVAAIPEGLPIVVTVTLALGVMRMANKKVIVKRLPSVETLGAVNVICADKTGTLTENKIVTTQIFTFSDGILHIDQRNTNYRLLRARYSVRKLAECCNLCNNATIEEEGEKRYGQPTELALLEFAMAVMEQDLRLTKTRLGEVAFSSETKWMSVEYDKEMFFKGAPEVIMPMCSRVLSDETRVPWNSELQNLADATQKRIANLGLRVIALANGSSTDDLTLIGFAGMYDIPREGVIETIARLHEGQVRVIMITGDSEGTAVTVAKQLGIIGNISEVNPRDQIMSGQQLEQSSDRDIQEHVKNTMVFYRTTPKHKLRIVEALQANGDVVAMTGDGVNDAPALKLADIGISMGKSGTDVSKEAADVILVDDNLGNILSAIEEGKSIFYNIRNFIKFQLSTSIAALSLIAISTIIGLPAPLNAMQILWINIIMDGPPAQSLGVEPPDRELMKKPPRTRKEPILDKSLIMRVLAAACIIVIGTLFIYYSQIEDGVITARDTTMTFTTFILFDMFNCLTSRSERKSIFTLGFLSNKPFVYSVGLSIICQILVIYSPFFQSIFQTERLTALELLGIVALTSSVWIIDELRKFYLNRISNRHSRQNSQGRVEQYELV